MLGEGYYYITKSNQLILLAGHFNLKNFDNFAKLLFIIIVPIIKDNILIYQALLITIAIIFFWTFYKVLVDITKQKFIALSATIFLSTNYLALFEYLGAGNYQRFVQRFPNLIPAVISFYFIWKFFKNKKTKFLIISIIFYIFAILMGQFSSLLLPLFIIYPIIQLLLEEKRKIRHLPLRITICFIFTFISLFLTQNSYQKPTNTPLKFLQTEKNISERILYQIPVITIPLDIVIFTAEHTPKPILYPYTSVLRFLLIPCLIFYLGGGILIYKRSPKLFILYLTFFLSMIAVMLTYMYVDTRLNVLNGFGEDRYYLLPSMFAVILWSMIIKAVFYKRKIRYVIISTLLLFVFVFYNMQKIRTHINKIQYQSEMNKKFISYFKDNHNSIPNDSYIVAPSYLAWPNPLITDVILENKNVEFILTSTDWQKNLWSKKNKVFVFDYDYQNEKLINLTDDFRNGEKITFKNQ